MKLYLLLGLLGLVALVPVVNKSTNSLNRKPYNYSMTSINENADKTSNKLTIKDDYIPSSAEQEYSWGPIFWGDE